MLHRKLQLPAKEGVPVAFTLEIAACPWNNKHQLARIGLAARKLEPGKMPPRNLVFLVDTSGSMNTPTRLPLLVQGLRLLVDELSHWKSNAEPFWESLLSTAAKRNHGLLLSILNAGVRTHWSYRIRGTVDRAST